MTLIWLVPMLAGAAMTEAGLGYWGYVESSISLVTILVLFLQGAEIAELRATQGM